MSSFLFRPSRLNTLRDGLRESSIGSLSRDFIGASGLVGRPEAALFWGQDVPASSRFLLLVMAEQVDSACDRVTYCEFVRHVEVALPRVVALKTCCSTRSPSAANLLCLVGLVGLPSFLEAAWWYGQPDLYPPQFLQTELVDSPPMRGWHQLIWPLSPFQAFEGGRRPEVGFGCQMVGSMLGFGTGFF